MNPLRSTCLLLALSISGTAVMAQQTPSRIPSSPGQADSTPQPHQTDETSSQQTARSFDGRITRSGDQLLLWESVSHTSYKLDDQSKAKQYEGRHVKVMATMDASSNTLHVIDIISLSRKR
jgi:hypothetical protein